jgi:hypothetical protein
MGRIILTGNDAPLPEDVTVERVHPQRERGRAAGRANADNDEVYFAVIDAALAALLNETTPEAMGERVYENLVGFVEGRSEALAKIEETEPLPFLTKAQTARVEALPRPVRRAWRAEYDRSVRRWHRAGGELSGRRLVLPVIPGDEPTA